MLGLTYSLRATPSVFKFQFSRDFTNHVNPQDMSLTDMGLVTAETVSMRTVTSIHLTNHLNSDMSLTDM